MTIQRPDYPFQLELIPKEIEDAQPNYAKWRTRKDLNLESKLVFNSLAEPPAWYEDYQRLVESGWPWRMAAYIAWSSVPKKLRWPKTQQDLAVNVLGLRTQRQISYWRCHIPAFNAAISDLRVVPLLEYRADVIQALIDSAINPAPKHHRDRKLFLEIAGIYTPTNCYQKKTPETSTHPFANKSDAELEQYLTHPDQDQKE